MSGRKFNGYLKDPAFKFKAPEKWWQFFNKHVVFNCMGSTDTTEHKITYWRIFWALPLFHTWEFA